MLYPIEEEAELLSSDMLNCRSLGFQLLLEFMEPILPAADIIPSAQPS
jgi:hypothetical protein